MPKTISAGCRPERGRTSSRGPATRARKGHIRLEPASGARKRRSAHLQRETGRTDRKDAEGRPPIQSFGSCRLDAPSMYTQEEEQRGVLEKRRNFAGPAGRMWSREQIARGMRATLKADCGHFRPVRPTRRPQAAAARTESRGELREARACCSNAEDSGGETSHHLHGPPCLVWRPSMADGVVGRVAAALAAARGRPRARRGKP